LDWRTTGAALPLRSPCTFWRLAIGPAAAALCTLGPAMVTVQRVATEWWNGACSATRRKPAGTFFRRRWIRLD
jgi:hypothetical protein